MKNKYIPHFYTPIGKTVKSKTYSAKFISELHQVAKSLNRGTPGLNLKITLPVGEDLDDENIKFVVFFNDNDGQKEKQYIDGYASNEAYLCFNDEDKWFFSYAVYDPGKMYERNGDPGNPPSTDFIEPGQNWDDVYAALVDLLVFRYKDSILETITEYQLNKYENIE